MADLCFQPRRPRPDLEPLAPLLAGFVAAAPFPLLWPDALDAADLVLALPDFVADAVCLAPDFPVTALLPPLLPFAARRCSCLLHFLVACFPRFVLPQV